MNVRNGFTILELVVVVVVVGVLTFALIPAFVNALSGAHMTVLGSKGKDIYIAITSANSEREVRHGSSAWPVRGAFKNSTDYFRHLFDEENYGTAAWMPKVTGFDYTLLAGSGVSQCGNNKLTPACNAWSIAECLSDEWDEVMPVLVTRNVDASSLASPDTITNHQWRLRFDTTWDMPFGERGMILIRKNGAIFKGRAKYLNYVNVYMNARQILRRAGNGEIIDHDSSVSYLTPTGIVVPGPESYANGLSHQLQQKQRLSWRLSKDIKAFKAIVPIMAVGWGAGYLIFFLVWKVIWLGKKKWVPLSISQVLFAVAHYCVTVLYSTVLASCFDINRRWCPAYIFLLAAIGQFGTVVWMTKNPEAKQLGGVNGLVCSLTPPLVVCGVFWFLVILTMLTF